MKKAKIKILRSRYPGGIVEEYIDGYVGDDFPGLGVHRSTYSRREWEITHLASGRYIMPSYVEIGTRKDAWEIAKVVAGCADWTHSEEELKRDDDAQRKFADALLDAFPERGWVK